MGISAPYSAHSTDMLLLLCVLRGAGIAIHRTLSNSCSRSNNKSRTSC